MLAGGIAVSFLCLEARGQSGLPKSVSETQGHTLRPGEWKTITSMKSVQSFAVVGDSIIAATSGGLFIYDRQTNAFSTFTTSEGLGSNDLTAAAVDMYGRIWVGSAGGHINMYELSTGKQILLRDIASSNYIQRSISRLVPHGDSLYVASQFGVSVLLTKKFEFGDSYTNLGFPLPTKVSDLLIQNNSIIVTTNSGVAISTLDEPALSGPSGWKTYTSANGLPSDVATSVAYFMNTIVVGTSSGAAYRSGSTFVQIPPFAGKNITSLLVRRDTLYALVLTSSGYRIESLDAFGNTSQLVLSSSQTGSSFGFANDGSVLVGTTTTGIAASTGNSTEYIYPNGPNANLFSNLVVDPRGILWVGSTIDNSGKGFYRYDPLEVPSRQWKNYTVDKYPMMQHNDYFRISNGANGSIWASSWGAGILEVRADTIRRLISWNTTPSLAGIIKNPHYVVTSGAAVDALGQTWIATLYAYNDNVLSCLINDTTFKYYQNTLMPSDKQFFSIVIDQNGTKWFTNQESFKVEGSSIGLYYFNEQSSIPGTTASGGWGHMTTADGLPADIIYSLVVDNDNNVCVGTANGMLIINDARYPKTRNTKPFSLRSESIFAIAVDGLNNKWVGTQEGVFVINSDGTQLLTQYTVATTDGKLASNTIRSIAIDQKSGIAYIGTDNGLSCLGITSIGASRSLTELEIAPNPFIIPSPTELIIRNLTAGSTLKIFSIDGTLITEFPAQGGGRAFWDGRDAKQRLVGSGIYIISAFSQNGEQLSKGKLAVIRK
jgi:ligand-binding sensor domain-containing protein